LNNSTILKIHREISRDLIWDKWLTEEEARDIVEKATVIITPDVKLVFTKEPKTIFPGFIRRWYHGTISYGIGATANTKTNTITIYPGQLKVSTLLHELAHIPLSSYFHYKSWQECFKKLVKWFNEKYSKEISRSCEKL